MFFFQFEIIIDVLVNFFFLLYFNTYVMDLRPL